MIICKPTNILFFSQLAHLKCCGEQNYTIKLKCSVVKALLSMSQQKSKLYQNPTAGLRCSMLSINPTVRIHSASNQKIGRTRTCWLSNSTTLNMCQKVQAAGVIKQIIQPSVLIYIHSTIFMKCTTWTFTEIILNSFKSWKCVLNVVQRIRFWSLCILCIGTILQKIMFT